MDVRALETPSVLIDLTRLEANIALMQAYCNALDLRLRPNVNAHKIPEIAQMQMNAGAVGITSQKLSEADIFAQAGFYDILIPYNILGPSKTNHLINLAIYNTVSVSADNMDVICGLSEAALAKDMSVRVLIELATDQKRAGCSIEEVVRLAQQIDADTHLHFAGLLVHPSTPSVRPTVQEAMARLWRSGIQVQTVSGGGMGAAHYAREFPELTELRVGNYVFNDWATVLNGFASIDQCALTISSTVASRPTADRAILDCGSKTISSNCMDGMYGFILQYPQALIYRLDEEHAYVDMSMCDERPQIGEQIEVVPIHAGVITNLHDTVYGVRNDRVEALWRVRARGKVR